MSNVKKLRSKVVDLEAIQFTGGAENATEIINWVLENGGTARYHESYQGHILTDSPEYLAIDTLEGTMRAEVSAWVFRGLEGEFYPVKDSVKKNKYDELSEDPDDLVDVSPPYDR